MQFHAILCLLSSRQRLVSSSHTQDRPTPTPTSFLEPLTTDFELEMRTTISPTKSSNSPAYSFRAANNWTVEGDREYVFIDQLQTLDTLFLNIVGAGDQWLFCSSDGALTAGRRSPETALFPYYTVDKIIDNWNCTGPWTAIVCNEKLWNPFRPSIALLSPTERRLMKGILGDEVVFDELHKELQLRFTYSWQFSERYGFVRKVKLSNESDELRTMRMVDGLDNLLPSGVDSRMQLQYSCLADAYKVSELECGGSLLVHRLAAGITDEPIPLESMHATTVWTRGLGSGPCYMARRDAEEFLRGHIPPPAPPNSLRAKRGAMFLARDLSLKPGESVEWLMVAEIDQSQAQVSELIHRLSDPASLEADVLADIEKGRDRLKKLVSSADGFQQTADRDTALYHYQNTLSNILRGGVPENGYSFKREQFIDYLRSHNRPLVDKHIAWFAQLPEVLNRSELLAKIDSLSDADLQRLAEEHLPLILSRRHGDPSRPWNRFDIRLRDEKGEAIHRFEGNWRDIFQNWEALAWSYPEILGGFISKFLNASTVDGFNPYRITSEGVDWEVPDEDDPWASIGYWGDHQIVYLLKLLELEAKTHPDHLASRLNSINHVFPDVPYRLESWEKTLEDPRSTVNFDRERHDHLMNLKSKIGADGLLLRDHDGSPVRVTLAEKLLLSAAVKLSNLVPSGGIWMNTQRPEWNDANNALAGCGLSVVTASYLYRYLSFVQKAIGNHPSDELLISPALATFIETLKDLLADRRWERQKKLNGKDRFSMVEAAGLAAERYRKTVYESGPGVPAAMSQSTIMCFLQNAKNALEGTLLLNRRSDGLWHAYNVLNIDHANRSMEIERLAVMLEGQVAILSSGILEPVEALELLEALPKSSLRSERHQTYLLYPDAEIPRFLESNRIGEESVNSIKTLSEMIQRGDTGVIVQDAECAYRFNPSLTNGYALKAVLDQLEGDPQTFSSAANDRVAIEQLYEGVFKHRSFTGRSGSMFGYEGLGCVYWHMVSKLMLAAQEVTLSAINSGVSEDIVESLKAAYFSIQSGLGYRRSPEQYGAFPAEPYSHSPGHAGAKQPGLTGQVKEGILCRLGELGVDFVDGRISFRPRLLRRAEFEGLSAGPEHDTLPPDCIEFTFAGTPVTYRRSEDAERPHGIVYFSDGTQKEAPAGILDLDSSTAIMRQTGFVKKVEVSIPSVYLLS